MKRSLKFCSLFAIIFLLLICLARFVFSQGKLEVTYPTIPFATPPASTHTPLSIFLKYIYNLSILLAGFLTLVLMIWGGIRYIFSAGNPSWMAEAKEQIQQALIGFLIIFSAYLILNTINPQLVLFSTPFLQQTPTTEIPPFNPSGKTIWKFREIPIGVVITSERYPSSFIYAFFGLATSTDPDTSKEDYPIISLNVSTSSLYTAVYQENPSATSTQYQGALEGRRLKRIHEVASTTLPATHMLADLSKQLVEIAEELKGFDEKLYQATKECNCSNCNCSSCGFGLPGPCPGPECDPCTGNPCSPATIQKIQDLREKIPKFYENENDPIPCKMAEIKYLAEHFRRFLESDINWPLVKNDDYEDESYYWSDEAKELRNKIKECINASYGWESWITSAKKGDDLRDEFEKIEEIIWNSSSSLAAVENKGTRSPKTDPPQRDVETNINHLEDQLNYLKQMRRYLNPYYFAQPLARAQLFALKEKMSPRKDIEIKTTSFPLKNFPSETLLVSDDPATFYTYPSHLSPFQETQRGYPSFVFAQEKVEVTCDRIVEIPIGKTMDEAIKLIEDILRELKNIYNKGGFMVEKVLEQIKEAKKLGQSSQELVDATDPSNIVPCELVRCKTLCHQITVHTPLGDVILHNCIGCLFERVNGYWYTEDQINKAYFDIKTEFSKINSLYQPILDAKESLYESFYKLNSVYPKKDPQHPNGHPKAGKRVPIGKDLCCKANDGNCRDENGNLKLDEIEERDYTLIEKLVEVQKLLNYSRKSKDFEQLIKALIEIEKKRTKHFNFDLASKEEIKNAYREQKVKQVYIGGKYDLTRCRMIYVDIQDYLERNVAVQYLENCHVAKWYQHIKQEICNPYDPPLDCDYFNFRKKDKKTPLNCYCYDEVWYRDYPDISSNFFCCIIGPQK